MLENPTKNLTVTEMTQRLHQLATTGDKYSRRAINEAILYVSKGSEIRDLETSSRKVRALIS